MLLISFNEVERVAPDEKNLNTSNVINKLPIFTPGILLAKYLNTSNVINKL